VSQGTEARAVLKAAIDGHRNAAGDQTGFDVLSRLKLAKGETLIAFARITACWTPEPEPAAAPSWPDEIVEMKGSPHTWPVVHPGRPITKEEARLRVRGGDWERTGAYLPEPDTLIGALVAGCRRRAHVGDRVAREKEALAAAGSARNALSELRRFLRHLKEETERPGSDPDLDDTIIIQPGQVEQIKDALHVLEQLIDRREELAAPTKGGTAPGRFKVGRQAASAGSPRTRRLDLSHEDVPEIQFDGQTIEGLKYAAKKIRAMAPKAKLGDIALVLNIGFEVAGVNAKSIENWTASGGVTRP
jgi:hypothetical protein